MNSANVIVQINWIPGKTLYASVAYNYINSIYIKAADSHSDIHTSHDYRAVRLREQNHERVGSRHKTTYIMRGKISSLSWQSQQGIR